MLRAMLKDGSWIGLLGLIGLGLLIIVQGAFLLSGSAIVGGAVIALGCFPFVAAFLALYWRKKRYGDGPTTDEREQWIRARGDSASAVALMIFWSLACLVPSAIARAQHMETLTIERSLLSRLLIVSLVIMLVARTAVIWHIRRRELANGQG